MVINLKEAQRNRIQIVRAIAIIMVVLTHTILWNPYELYFRPFINPAVAVFIFLSGLLTKLNIEKGDIIGFYKRRLVRVLIPYILWSMVYVVITGDYKNFVFNLLIGNCCSTYYYIIVYIQLVIITPLAIRILNSKAWLIGFFITPLAIVIEYILAFNGFNLIYPFNINNLFVWFVFYYLGLCLGYEKIKINKNHKSLIVLILVLVIGVLIELAEALLWDYSGRRDIATSQVKISTMCVSIIVCVISYCYIMFKGDLIKKNTFIERVFVQVGNCSFGIYLIHQLIILLWNKYIPDIKVDNSFWFVAQAIIVVVICTLLVSLGQKVFGKKIGKKLGFY